MAETKRVAVPWIIYVIFCLLLAALLFLGVASNQIPGLSPEIKFFVPGVVKPDSEIQIFFSQAVKSSSVENTFRVTPDVAGKIVWEPDFKSFTFTPQEAMWPSQKYVIAFSGETNYWIPFEAQKEFQVERAPEVASVFPFQGQGVRPDSKIFVKFDKPVENYHIDFNIKPETKFRVEKNTDDTEFALIPEELLLTEQTYEVEVFRSYLFDLPDFSGAKEQQQNEQQIENVPSSSTQSLNKPEEKVVMNPQTSQVEGTAVEQANNLESLSTHSRVQVGVEKERVKTFSFATLAPLDIVTSQPTNGKRDILLNQRITLGFNKPVDLESFRESLDFQPATLYQIIPSENEKTIVIKPDELKADTDYKLTFKNGMRAKDGSYLEEDKFVYFKTGNASGVVKDERRATDDPVIKDGKLIDINLSTQLMDIYSDGMLLGTYRISSGKSGMNTPTGRYAVMTKERRHWSHQYKLWMPFSMQFTGAGHFIHELPEWPNGYKEGANHLGWPVSHGCVRLGVGPAETVFNFAEFGTPINIHY